MVKKVKHSLWSYSLLENEKLVVKEYCNMLLNVIPNDIKIQQID